MYKNVDFIVTLSEPWITRRDWDNTRHWAARSRIIADYARQIGDFAACSGILGTFQTFHLEAIRYHWRTLDADNLTGGLKPVIDAMRINHPQGCGLILEDNATVMAMVQPQQVKLRKDQADQYRSELILSGTLKV